MKHLIIALLFLATAGTSTYAHNLEPIQETPKVGSELIIKAEKGHKYNHINFPRLNEIVKRGGISSYKSVHNCAVIITSVEEKDGITTVTLERKDGKKFFNQQKTVTADYKSALGSGELAVK